MQLFNLEGDIGVVTGALGKLGPIWVETLLAAGARVLASIARHPETPAFQDLRPASGLNDWRSPSPSLWSPELEAALVRCGRPLRQRPTILVNNAGIDAPRQPAARATGWKRFPWPSTCGSSKSTRPDFF